MRRLILSSLGVVAFSALALLYYGSLNFPVQAQPADQTRKVIPNSCPGGQFANAISSNGILTCAAGGGGSTPTPAPTPTPDASKANTNLNNLTNTISDLKITDATTFEVHLAPGASIGGPTVQWGVSGSGNGYMEMGAWSSTDNIDTKSRGLHVLAGGTFFPDGGTSFATGQAVNFNKVTPYWTEFSAGNTGTAITIDWTANGKMQTATVNGSATFTFTAPPGPTLGLCLRLVHDGTATAYTLTWPSGANGVKWPGGVAGANTNTASAEDLLICNYVGSHYDCTMTVNFS